MKHFKNILSLLLAMLMLLSVASAEVKLGLLEVESTGGHKDHEDTVHTDRLETEPEIEYIYYDNLTSALMDVANGKTDFLSLEKASAAYVISRNEALTQMEMPDSPYKTEYCMMVMEENKEVYDVLNNAIVALKADGTLDKLIETDLKAYIETDPVPAELPAFEGAQTIRIGVTGDLPPMDFVAANGKAAGFNIALLTEIANLAQLNIELVQIETGARAMALASGKVDAIFWTRSVVCNDCEESWLEDIEGTLATESYFSDFTAWVVRKAD